VQTIASDPGTSERLVEQIEGLRSAGFGAIDERLDAVKPVKLRIHGSAEMVKGEIGQPHVGASMRLNCVEQYFRPADPFKGVQRDHRQPQGERHDEAGNQAHVVIERQPGGEAIGGRKPSVAA